MLQPKPQVFFYFGRDHISISIASVANNWYNFGETGFLQNLHPSRSQPTSHNKSANMLSIGDRLKQV